MANSDAPLVARIGNEVQIPMDSTGDARSILGLSVFNINAFRQPYMVEGRRK